MHHKFCLIDGKTVISGSYNWTYAAQRNQENIVVSDQEELVKAFRVAFDSLLNHAAEVASISSTVAQAPPVTNAALEFEAKMEVEYSSKDKALDNEQQTYENAVLTGNAAYFQKKYDEAETALRHALALKPNGVEAFELLAGLYWRTKQYRKSVDAAKKAEGFGLKSAELYNAFGLAYDGLKMYKEAVSYFNRAIDLAPHLSTPYRNKTIAQYSNRQTKDSEATALEGGRVASETIKKYRNGGNQVLLLHAYMDRAYLHSDLPEARKYAQEALTVFNQLPTEEQDMHELDEIKSILQEKLRF